MGVEKEAQTQSGLGKMFTIMYTAVPMCGCEETTGHPPILCPPPRGSNWLWLGWLRHEVTMVAGIVEACPANCGVFLHIFLQSYFNNKVLTNTNIYAKNNKRLWRTRWPQTKKILKACGVRSGLKQS